MSIQQIETTSFLMQLLEGVHDFRPMGGDTFKIALYGEDANLNSTTTAYTATGEIVATGYTAGGATLTTIQPASGGTTGYTNFASVSWTNSNIQARGALIYNITPAHTYTNPSVIVLDFGMLRYADSGGTFLITFPTSNSTSALIRLNAGTQT